MTNLSLDACLVLVADRQRRRILQYLRHETDGTTTIDDLVRQFDSGRSASEADPPLDQDELAIQLHHTHLPKLAAHDVVEFDYRSGAIRYRPDEQLETVLDSVDDDVTLPNR